MKPATTIEAQIEAAWLALLDVRGARCYFLTACGRLSHGEPDAESAEIGTFTRAISLADFRAEVFAVYGELRGAQHGRD